MVTVGQTAPDFLAPGLTAGEGVGIELFQEIRTHEAVLLYFYPADFVPECTAELRAMRDAEWHSHDTLRVFGLSGDSLFSHAAYAREHDLPFTLVSDFHASVAESYSLCLDEWEGHTHIPARAAVVVDGDWEVRGIERAAPLGRVSPAPVERLSGTLRSLDIPVEKPSVAYEQ